MGFDAIEAALGADAPPVALPIALPIALPTALPTAPPADASEQASAQASEKAPTYLMEAPSKPVTWGSALSTIVESEVETIVQRISHESPGSQGFTYNMTHHGMLHRADIYAMVLALRARAIPDCEFTPEFVFVGGGGQVAGIRVDNLRYTATPSPDDVQVRDAAFLGCVSQMPAFVVRRNLVIAYVLLMLTFYAVTGLLLGFAYPNYGAYFGSAMQQFGLWTIVVFVLGGVPIMCTWAAWYRGFRRYPLDARYAPNVTWAREVLASRAS